MHYNAYIFALLEYIPVKFMLLIAIFAYLEPRVNNERGVTTFTQSHALSRAVVPLPW